MTPAPMKLVLELFDLQTLIDRLFDDWITVWQLDKL